MELRLFDPTIAVPILQDGLLVCTHQGRLLVHPLGPSSASHHLDHHLVDLCEAHHIVAVEIEPPPQRLEGGMLDEAVIPHILVERHAELHEHVIARRNGGAHHTLVGAPLAILVAASPRTWQRGRIGAILGALHIGPTSGAIINLFADDPSSLSRMEEVAGRHRACHPDRPVVVCDLHGLVGIIYELVLARTAGNLDRGRHPGRTFRTAAGANASGHVQGL
mmetsp:Transcript_128646/g.274540  ORF Transcript_128646/g.274540 Transcript_128646/m.274540 type:complete len:221 (-) Transcript_128646:17-679(-)